MNWLELPRAGREYVRLSFVGLPPGSVDIEARVGNGAWTPVEVTGSTGRFLVRGPDATGSDGLLVASNATVEVRLTDSPEIVLRDAGEIFLV